MSGQSAILDQARRPTVTFDPKNPLHVGIIKKVMEGKGISDAPVRFAYRYPFTSGVTQAIHAMAEQWADQLLKAEGPKTFGPGVVSLRRKDG